MATTRRCGGCKLPLGAGQFITAASQAFHIACFTCSKCRNPISGSFVTAGGQYVCVNCSTASAPACSGCGAKITEGSIVTVKGLSFHPQHFACANCGVNLQSGLGSSSNGVYVFEAFGTKPRAMCGRCHATASGRVCCSCSQPILGQHVVADGRQYHNHCWTCAGCKRELAGVGYHRSFHFTLFSTAFLRRFRSILFPTPLSDPATEAVVAANATLGSPACCVHDAKVCSPPSFQPIPHLLHLVTSRCRPSLRLLHNRRSIQNALAMLHLPRLLTTNMRQGQQQPLLRKRR